MSFGAIWKTRDMSFEEAYRKANKVLYRLRKRLQVIAFYETFGEKDDQKNVWDALMVHPIFCVFSMQKAIHFVSEEHSRLIIVPSNST